MWGFFPAAGGIFFSLSNHLPRSRGASRRAEQSESGKQRQGRQSEAGSHPPLLELSKAGAGSVPAYCGEAEAAAARGARRAARIIVFSPESRQEDPKETEQRG